MIAPADRSALLRSSRRWLIVFMLGLFLSGVTAFPLETELRLAVRATDAIGLPQHLPLLAEWLLRVRDALIDTNARYAFLAYGTDWLAFAHVVLAVAFVGPYRDPVQNEWVVDFGLIACAGVLPLALIAGPIRGIPLYWRIIDCSFGVFGCVPLLLVRRNIAAMKRLNVSSLASAGVNRSIAN